MVPSVGAIAWGGVWALRPWRVGEVGGLVDNHGEGGGEKNRSRPRDNDGAEAEPCRVGLRRDTTRLGSVWADHTGFPRTTKSKAWPRLGVSGPERAGISVDAGPSCTLNAWL